MAERVGDALVRTAKLRVLALEQELANCDPRDSRKIAHLNVLLFNAQRSLNFNTEMNAKD